MKNTILTQYRFNLVYAKKLVEDLTEAQMTVVPSPGLENHPSFTLGHLITGSAILAEDLGGEREVPAGWAELFERRGPSDPRRPDPDAARYPSRAALLTELERQHDYVEKLLLEIDQARLLDPVEWRLGTHLPTLGDLVTFLCISHELLHLGQLAAWRRAMGLPSALAGV